MGGPVSWFGVAVFVCGMRPGKRTTYNARAGTYNNGPIHVTNDEKQQTGAKRLALSAVVLEFLLFLLGSLDLSFLDTAIHSDCRNGEAVAERGPPEKAES